MEKYNIQVLGNANSEETLVFAHGFGSEQTAWRLVYPAFEENYRIVLFDFPGSKPANSKNFDIQNYNSLNDYADDLMEITHLAGVRRGVLIAHSASCMIGALASLRDPDLFKGMVFICGSPRYRDDGDYKGGFSQEKIGTILNEMSHNYAEWIRTYAPAAVNDPNKPELVEEFSHCLLQLRPDIGLVVFSLIIMSDYRREVAKVELPTSIVQPQEDIFVPATVGAYLYRTMKNSELYWIDTPGHFPHLANPTEIIKAITSYLAEYGFV
ncbi:alpha/beta hydrolase [Synechocystis sp. PCC 7339]|uniref:alpha/beta fold hydrolase n=1 Tax=Synechocystis sp. PCC 7339 TaxID=2782213 RepID=UPI001CC152F9|nr:alpha/beta hydrolase [Synechocystis sp. PCC 7339]UAJ72840.1 alpha/beta hydrolase [Synechocystis sp. PCC 7339]